MSEEEWDAICADLSPRQPPVDAEGFWTPKGSADWTWPVLLKRLRVMRGLTQKSLAEEAGIVQSHVAKAEAGSEVYWSTRPIVPFEIR